MKALKNFFILFFILISSFFSQGLASQGILTLGAGSNPQLQSDKLYKDFASNLKASESSFNVRLMTNQEGGSDEQNFYQVRRGRMQMGGVSYGAISTVIPELAVINVPFLFDSYKEIDFILDNGLENKLNSKFLSKGLVGLRHIPASWHILYGKKPHVMPVDFKNIRVRSRIERSSHLFLKSLEADVIHVSGTEVVTSLQTGLIEAGETNSFVYFLTGFHSEAPYLIFSKHVPSVTTIIANKKWWNSLSSEHQNMIDKSLAPAQIWRDSLRNDEEKLTKFYEEEGKVKVQYLSKKQRNHWTNISMPSRVELLKELGSDARQLYNFILELKEKFPK